MKRQKNLKGFKKLPGSMAMAFAMLLGVVFINSLQVSATEMTENGTTENGTTGSEVPDSETVAIIIDNSVSHLVVRFYPDIHDTDNFEVVETGAEKTYMVPKDSVARIRLYIQADGYCVPENYVIEGASKLTDDDRVNSGWCRAAYSITADAAKTITIPEATVCTHPYADPSVRWGYYDCGDGTHAQSCTLCASDIPGTTAKHTLSEMTATEYADWYYSDSNFENVSEENIALWKADLVATITKDLGVDANTKIKCCTVCEHWEKIENTAPEAPQDSETSGETSQDSETSGETPQDSETSGETPQIPETPTVLAISASLKDNNGVLPEGAAVTAVSAASGEAYEKAAAAVQQKISGLGQFAVMEINLTDTSNTQIHQLNGYVQVTIPLPGNINVHSGKTISVYRLEDDGSLTRCQTVVENGAVTFLTNHFSTYIIVEENAVTAPKTGDNSYRNYVVCIMVLMLGLGLAVMAKKKIN